VLCLVIDTSSAAVTAAVAAVGTDQVELRAERVVVDARAHGELLAPLIEQCLTDADAGAGGGIGAIGAVVAGLGPGPFTGLRVGLVTAAVLGDLRGVPTYGVCSLDAYPAGRSGPLLVAADARRREIYWARYVDGARVTGPSVHRPADLPGRGGDARVIGAGARLYHDVLGGELLDGDHPSALGLAQAAADRIRVAAPSERLVPLYLRRPDAVAPTEYKPVSR
jgi:tRNA threonylcarbamoyl adenosine modification protein YeaZ